MFSKFSVFNLRTSKMWAMLQPTYAWGDFLAAVLFLPQTSYVVQFPLLRSTFIVTLYLSLVFEKYFYIAYINPSTHLAIFLGMFIKGVTSATKVGPLSLALVV